MLEPAPIASPIDAMSKSKKKKPDHRPPPPAPPPGSVSAKLETITLKNRMNQLLMFNIAKPGGKLIGVEIPSLGSIVWPKLSAGYGPDVSRLLKRGHLTVEP